jgi:2-(1,2-epoxy-1,2-dihydrophenyl)acetyl-CoA isomerase
MQMVTKMTEEEMPVDATSASRDTSILKAGLPGVEFFKTTTVSARADGELAWIALEGERPFVIGESFPSDLIGALDAVEASGAHGVVLAGTTAVFCAGADLRLGQRLREREFATRWLETQHEALARLTDCPLPTVAAVHAAAAGAGCNLALACDHVVAARSARFSQAFVRIGLATDMGSLFLLWRRAGVQSARELMLSGRDVSGDEALRLRLADELCSVEEVWPRARTVATERATGPLDAYAAIKAGLAQSIGLGLGASLDLEQRLQLDVMATPDFAEGTTAFLEKRAPRFGN